MGLKTAQKIIVELSGKMAGLGYTGLWPAVIILCREILVSGLREFLAEIQVGLPVTRLALPFLSADDKKAVNAIKLQRKFNWNGKTFKES